MKMKKCVLVDNNKEIHQLSYVGKSILLAESAYQVLQVITLLNQLAIGHTYLLFPRSSSREVKGSKSCYDLEEDNMVSFERLYFVLCSRLSEVSSLLEQVKEFGSLVALPDQITELESEVLSLMA